MKLKDLEDKIAGLTGKNRERLESIRHEHRQTLKYYRHRVGLTRRPNDAEYEWLNQNTKGCYSLDYTMPPHNLSFEERSDAVRFKLTFGGELACKAHQKL